MSPVQTTDPNDPRIVLTARALTVKLNAQSPDSRILLSAATIIRQGGIVGYPTETVYGLAADPFNPEAISRLHDLKQRGSRQPLILLLSHPGSVWDLARLGGPARTWFDSLTRQLWPGPLTLVLPAKPRLACAALAGGDTVAVRLSSHPVARRLVQTVGHPITSTSANLTGGEAASEASQIDPRLASRLGLLLDAGPSPGGPPSTILDLTGARPVILRPGSVPAERITQVLGFAPRGRSAA